MFEQRPVAGTRIGHWTSAERPTGCTVVLTPGSDGQGATAGVDVRGAAPGTRETDALHAHNSVDVVHGLVLSGGSAFGLDAASGVMQWLENHGYGLRVGPALVPIVPAAVLFDLWHPMRHIRPDAAAGFAAAQSATEALPPMGAGVGAAAGGRVGKFFGIDRADVGGMGYASLNVDGVRVAALVAVNALGDVVDEGGRIVCGAKTPDGRGFEDCAQAIRTGRVLPYSPPLGSNTTIGVVMTDAVLTKVQANRIAQCAHDGLARSIAPVHTSMDGDTLFCVGTGLVLGTPNMATLCAVAADVVAQAVRWAVNPPR